MEKGYWIAHIEVTDETKYALFAEHCAEVIDRIGGKILVRGENGRTPLGTSRSRTVVVEFPSFAEAVEQFEDPQNLSATELMRRCCEIDLVIVPGVVDEPTQETDSRLELVSHLAAPPH